MRERNVRVRRRRAHSQLFIALPKRAACPYLNPILCRVASAADIFRLGGCCAFFRVCARACPPLIVCTACAIPKRAVAAFPSHESARMLLRHCVYCIPCVSICNTLHVVVEYVSRQPRSGSHVQSVRNNALFICNVLAVAESICFASSRGVIEMSALPICRRWQRTRPDFRASFSTCSTYEVSSSLTLHSRQTIIHRFDL